MNSTCAMFRNEQKEYQRCTINKLDCFAMIKRTPSSFLFGSKGMMIVLGGVIINGC